MTTLEDIDEMLDIIKEFELHLKSIIKNKYNNNIDTLINLVNMIDEYYKSIDEDTEEQVDSDIDITSEEKQSSEEETDEDTDDEEKKDEEQKFINGKNDIHKYNIYTKSTSGIKNMKKFIEYEF